MDQTIVHHTSEHGTFSWKHLPWDSHILERRVAKVITLEVGTEMQQRRILIQELLADLQRNDITYATYRIHASDFLTIHALEDMGFRLVDGYVTLKATLTIPFAGIPSMIREAKEQDVQSLQSIARYAFSYTRFFNDPSITKDQAGKIYSEWIANSILQKREDRVLVWGEQDRLSGFVTLKKDGHLALIAVAKEAQGRGIGTLLVKACMNQFLAWRLQESNVETQITNISALRIYQSCGYKIVDSYFTFRWISETKNEHRVHDHPSS